MGALVTRPLDLTEINNHIQLMKETAENLNRLGEDFPAISRNTARILASIRMLEINISDVLDLEESR
jgi:hypothetical protein